MSRLSPLPRSHSRASQAPSDTTFHSFHDAEDQAAAGSSVPVRNRLAMSMPAPATESDRPGSQKMRRQDSGYASITPRPSYSSPRHAASVTGSTHRPRSRRPSIRRSTKSGPVAQIPKPTHPHLFAPRPPSQSRHTAPQLPTFFHFPKFAPAEPEAEEMQLMVDSRLAHDLYSSRAYSSVAQHPDPAALGSEAPIYSLPPQTTHYWTSDRTRRLEYAAIDAASKGVRGWMMRHMVPDCFVPKDRRRIRFEDDRGSVVRHRIDLEVEEKDDTDKCKRRRSWLFSN